MVIRCERCSTMYELDESLLAPTGSDVQCTKCEHVFVAFPPRSAGRTLIGVPAQPPEPSRTPDPDLPPEVPAAAPPPPPAPRRTPARGATPAVYRPATSAAPVGRAPVLKRDTVGTFEARLRWSARWRWLAPAIAVGCVVLAGTIWLLVIRSGHPGASRAHAEALALLALDDSASLEGAAARLRETTRRVPGLNGAAGDHALALALRAASLLDERDALAAKASLQTQAREKLRREEPAGWEEAERAATAEASALEGEVRTREEKARALAATASDELRTLASEEDDVPEVVRAAAVLHIVNGERDQAQKSVRSARRGDPWLDLVDGWLDARDPDRAMRERALVKLGALAAARPDLLRGRYLLAGAQMSLGRRPEALATLDGILAANPRHDGARRLKEEVAAANAPVAPPTPPTKSSPSARKSFSQSAQGPSAPAPEPGSPGGTTGPPSASAFAEKAPAAAPATPQTAPADAPPPRVRRAPRPAPAPEPDGF